MLLIMIYNTMELKYIASMAPVMGIIEKTAWKEQEKPEIDLTVSTLTGTVSGRMTLI